MVKDVSLGEGRWEGRKEGMWVLGKMLFWNVTEGERVDREVL